MMFILENERSYAGASTLYEKMTKLNINPTLYELPVPFIFKPEEVFYWTDSLLNETRGCQYCEEVQYIERVCKALRGWAGKGYIVHIR